MSRQSFLASFIFTWCIVAGQTTEYGLLGGTINIKTGIKTAIDEILWKHNGNKAVEFNGNEEHAYSSFEHRVTLDWHSADLSISGLTYEDSGNYDLEAFSDNLLQRLKYTLKVIDKVAKPTISCKILNDNDNSGHVAKLTCSAEPSQPPALMTFEWTSHSHSGPELPILLGHEQDKEVYSCTVSNPLTNDSATFTAKDCYGESSTGRTVGIILGILAGIVFLILFILFMWWRLKHKAEKNSDEENRAPEKINGPEDETGDSESRKPLIHRSSTRPSEQRLDHWNRSETDVENHEDKDEKIPPVPKKRHSHVDPHNNGDLESEPADPVKATDALINEQAEDTKHHMADDLQSPTANEQPDVETHKDEDKKIPLPVPKKRLSRAGPHNNGDLESEPAHPVKAMDASFNEQTEDTQHQMADDLQSPAANEQPGLPTKTPPPVPEKPRFGLPPHNNGDLENKPADPVKATDASFNEQTEDTQHQMADDLQSPAANEQPDVQKHKVKVKKPPPPVPKKRHSYVDPHNNGDLENEPADPVKTTDASFNEQAEDTQHQMADDLRSPTANEQPEKEAEEDEKEEEDANTDQAAGKSTEANVRESDSTGLREGNESDNLSMEQEGREGEEATAHKQQSKINTVKDNQQEQKEEENVVLDTTQSLRAP
ncbi:glutamic acid-rich protein-like isoform X7 [Parambassis ranga]|uniref:Glutamic acid-rich protein-like isoform X7 n=1 Tax=Parambassis ranga TaxID=210632 RepID=A0A6P7H4X2_9TELE|nr:glutamic acid-rich protein-like isoform X7 [Parambassis ranga]